MDNESRILSELARKYAEIASDSRNDENRKLYIASNDLKPVRPVVLLDEIPWSEFREIEEMRPACADPFLRDVETRLRRIIYQWRNFPGDMIVPAYFPVDKVIYSSGNGINIKEETRATDIENSIISHSYMDQLSTEEQLEKLRVPEITYDKDETMRRCEVLSGIFRDVLPVKPSGLDLYDNSWDLVSRYRGVTALLMDLVDRPEFMHKTIEKMTGIYLATIKRYEGLGLLEPNRLLVHCTPALSNDLPAEDFDGEKVRLRDIWGRGAAQIFGHVSREMHEEFDIEYMKRAMEPFGLTYYGCCEPLHEKIDLVEKIPHLRKISITPWADIDVACDIIGKKYVVSVKPNPANVASGALDDDIVKNELGRILSAIGRNGCASDIVLKDISTAGNNPENLSRWEKIAMSMVK